MYVHKFVVNSSGRVTRVLSRLGDTKSARARGSYGPPIINGPRERRRLLPRSPLATMWSPVDTAEGCISTREIAAISVLSVLPACCFPPVCRFGCAIYAQSARRKITPCGTAIGKWKRLSNHDHLRDQGVNSRNQSRDSTRVNQRGQRSSVRCSVRRSPSVHRDHRDGC